MKPGVGAAGLPVRRPFAASGKRGFSLVELLAALAIVGTLVGLLLPTVQRVRESARRTACGNNLRQATLATLAYEAGRGRFPAGCDRLPSLPSLPAGTLHAWTSSILPFLEEAELASRIDSSRVKDSPANGTSTATLELLSGS